MKKKRAKKKPYTLNDAKSCLIEVMETLRLHRIGIGTHRNEIDALGEQIRKLGCEMAANLRTSEQLNIQSRNETLAAVESRIRKLEKKLHDVADTLNPAKMEAINALRTDILREADRIKMLHGEFDAMVKKMHEGAVTLDARNALQLQINKLKTDFSDRPCWIVRIWRALRGK